MFEIASRHLKSIFKHSISRAVAAIFGGILTSFAFSPYEVYPLAFCGPIICLLLWQHDRPQAAFFHGWLYTMGLLMCGGYWLDLAPKALAEIHSPLAEILTLVVIAIKSLYMGISGAVYAWLRPCFSRSGRVVLLFPVLWVFAEWWRGLFMTGFSWFSIGYAFIDSPLAGWAILFGVYGVSLAALTSAGAIVAMVTGNTGTRIVVVLLLISLWLGGLQIQHINWTVSAGKPLSIALVQPNEPTKDNSDINRWERHIQLTEELLAEHELVVWPESIFMFYLVEIDSYKSEAFIADGKPLAKNLWTEKVLLLDDKARHFAVTRNHEVAIWGRLEKMAKMHNKAIILGTSFRDSVRDLRHNALLAINSDSSTFYDKRHLVPFGEVIPLWDSLNFLWDWLNFYESTYHPGRAASNLVPVANFQAGVSICYESGFGNEIAEALPAANFLIMISDDHIFDGTTEPFQHQQIVRMRALETGRWIARVTNTGITSLIDSKGAIVASLSPGKSATLSGTLEAVIGITPYGYWGNGPVLLYMVMLLILSLLLKAPIRTLSGKN